MKKLLLIPLAFFFIAVGCEKEVVNRMENLYHESMGLPNVTLDSVKSFSAKVNNYVTQYPDEKSNPLYPLIIDNIKSAQLKITIIIDDKWKDSTYIYF